MTRQIAIAALLIAGPAWAQNSGTATITLSSPLDWTAIVRCADQDLGPSPPPLPDVKMLTPAEQKAFSDSLDARVDYYRRNENRILCAAMRLAYHEGWKAAAPDTPDPIWGRKP
jgi:hypothetical protein